MQKSLKAMLSNICLKIQSLCSATEDTGWVNLTPAKGTWSFLKYRKIGNMVNIRGHATAYTWDGSSGDDIANLPAAILPGESINLYFWGVCKGRQAAKLGINLAGKRIFLDSVTSLIDGSYITTSCWLNFNVTYFIGGGHCVTALRHFCERWCRHESLNSVKENSVGIAGALQERAGSYFNVCEGWQSAYLLRHRAYHSICRKHVYAEKGEFWKELFRSTDSSNKPRCRTAGGYEPVGLFCSRILICSTYILCKCYKQTLLLHSSRKSGIENPLFWRWCVC